MDAVHRDVTLTPEGEKIWQEVTSPDSEVGKLIGFKQGMVINAADSSQMQTPPFMDTEH